MAANQHESALLGHFQRVEDALLAQSKVAASSGHSVLQGTAREAFVREFLESHLAERLGVGTGEVISADSKIDDERNQLDVLVYSRGYPKLYIGGSVSLFLIEAVLAVLEVKTTLDKEELKTAIRTARRLKTLPRNLRPTTSEIADWEPPLLYYVVAYGGYKTLAGIHKAILEIHDEEHIVVPAPVAWKGDAPDALGAYKKERITRKNPSIDGVILLGKGYVQFDNANAWFLPDATRKQFPATNWESVEQPGIGLLHIYMNLLRVADTHSLWLLDPAAYQAGVGVPGDKIGALFDEAAAPSNVAPIVP